MPSSRRKQFHKLCVLVAALSRLQCNSLRRKSQSWQQTNYILILWSVGYHHARVWPPAGRPPLYHSPSSLPPYILFLGADS